VRYDDIHKATPPMAKFIATETKLKVQRALFYIQEPPFSMPLSIRRRNPKIEIPFVECRPNFAGLGRYSALKVSLSLHLFNIEIDSVQVG